MANGRHSYVGFYPSDWLAGTARLPRIHRSVLFDICCYIWDAAKPVPARELALMLADVKDSREIIDDLILMEKIAEAEDGSITNARAMAEAEKSHALWLRKSEGGRKARSHSMSDGKSDGKTDAITPPIEPEPEPEPTIKAPNGACASGDAPALELTGEPVEELKPAHVVEEWNKLAPKLGKPKVRDLTPARSTLLKARISQYELDDFLTVFGAVERSAFLRGDTGWQGCTFDWIFKRANFQKILEGNYDA